LFFHCDTCTILLGEGRPTARHIYFYSHFGQPRASRWFAREAEFSECVALFLLNLQHAQLFDGLWVTLARSFFVTWRLFLVLILKASTSPVDDRSYAHKCFIADVFAGHSICSPFHVNDAIWCARKSVDRCCRSTNSIWAVDKHSLRPKFILNFYDTTTKIMWTIFASKFSNA